MTLSSTSVKSLYNGDSSTKAFATGFIFWNSSELQVILVSSSGSETTWTEGTQYSVTGGGGATGTVTASTTPVDYTPASGKQLLIRSALEDIQATSLPAGGVFPSTAVEQELDRIVRRLQEKEEELTRSIKLAVSSTFADLILPAPEASKFIRWNSAATELENADVGDVSAVGLPIPVTDGGTGATTAAGARTALGVVPGTDVADVGDVTASGLTMAAARLLGRASSGTGALEEIDLGAEFTLSNSSLSIAASSDALAGIIEIAIQSELETGTDTGRAVTPGRQHFHPSAAKAWWRYDQTGTAAVVSSYNVNSITDDATGEYIVVIETDMSGTIYTAVVHSDQALAATGEAPTTADIHAIAAGTLEVHTKNTSSSLVDCDWNTGVIFGDI